MRKLFIFVLLLPVSVWSQSPFDGTWKMNMSTAQFDEEPQVFVLQSGEYVCSRCSPKLAVKADGADHSVKGDTDYDTLSVKQVDVNSVRFTRKKKGKIVGQNTDTVSPDGNTLISEFKDYPPEGQATTGTIIFTRAAPGPKGAHAISGAWRTAKVENLAEQNLAMNFKSTPDGLSVDLPFYHESYAAKFDGKEYPVKGESGGTVSLQKVNDRKILETRRRDNKTISVNEITIQGSTMRVVSKDLRGETMMSFTADKQ